MVTEQDRRVRRTRRILHDALIALVLERSYERVTVQDILDRADVGRSTFYAHYRDKEALLLSSFDGMREELLAQIDSGPRVDPVAVIFEHAFQNRRVYRALCGHQGGEIVHKHLRLLLGEFLREQLRPGLEAAGSDIPAEVIAEFYTSAALGLLVWWIDRKFPHDPAWITGIYRRLAAPGLASYTGGSTGAGGEKRDKNNGNLSGEAAGQTRNTGYRGYHEPGRQNVV
jgi:AcrR family transcriptional regulator